MASIKRIGKDKNGIPIWKAIYRRTPGGKQVMRHFHMESKAEVERAVMLDCNSSDIGLTWSEGGAICINDKRAEGCSPAALENVERTLRVFQSLMGDTAIEATPPWKS